MHRRQFLIASAALGLGARNALAGPAVAQARPKVIVVGAGFGGAACARHLKLWDARIEVTLIEPNTHFVSCPLSNTVVAGLNRIEDLTFPYRYLQAGGDRFVTDAVTAIDADKRTVTTAGGAVWAVAAGGSQ